VFTLEDLGGALEVTVFPRTLMEHGHKLLDDQIITVKGRLDKRDESRIGFMAQDIQVVEHLDGGETATLHLRLPATSLNELRVHQLRRILRDHPGEAPVVLHIGNGKMIRIADDFRVDTDLVVGELRVAFGHDAVML
jgi:DNA polymerase-3 subunit alpha